MPRRVAKKKREFLIYMWVDPTFYYGIQNVMANMPQDQVTQDRLDWIANQPLQGAHTFELGYKDMTSGGVAGPYHYEVWVVFDDAQDAALYKLTFG